MANEGSYVYATPGGFAPPPHSVHLKRYVEPDEIGRPMNDFVTFKGVVDVMTSPLGLLAGAIGLGWWFKSRRRR